MRIYFVFRVFSLAFPLKCLVFVFECLVFLIFICYFKFVPEKKTKYLTSEICVYALESKLAGKCLLQIDDKTR